MLSCVLRHSVFLGHQATAKLPLLSYDYDDLTEQGHRTGHYQFITVRVRHQIYFTRLGALAGGSSELRRHPTNQDRIAEEKTSTSWESEGQGHSQ